MLPALVSLFLAAFALAHDEHTSEWYYIDGRWPRHVGNLVDEREMDRYLEGVLGEESTAIRGWKGKAGLAASDTVVTCGLEFTGYIRQRPRGTYLLLVARATTDKPKVLKWIPLEYRFDNGAPEEFFRRHGSPELLRRPGPIGPEEQQEDIAKREGRPDIKESPELREPLEYQFEGDRRQPLPRGTGHMVIRPGVKYLEAVKFPEPRKFKNHERLQAYLPWIEGCREKPELQFRRDDDEETLWDWHLRDWVSTGLQYMMPYMERGWRNIRPNPSLYLRGGHVWDTRHGLTAEVHAAFVSGAKQGGSETGWIVKASYARAFWLGKWLTLTPEAGFRGFLPQGGDLSPGWGVGIGLAWEVPGTRHQHSGQRLIFETGCDLARHYGLSYHGEELLGVWTNCKFGIGLGW